MLYLDCNMPSKIFLSPIGAKILRIGRVNNTNTTSYNAAKTIIQCIVKQGGKFNTINKTLNKVFLRKSESLLQQVKILFQT